MSLAEEIDFIVLKEDYSRYILHDKTIVKAKVLLRKIFFTPDKTPEGYPTNTGFDSLNIAVTFVPKNLKRPPSVEPYDPQKDKGSEIRFEEQEVKTQEYMTTNGFKITIKPVLTKVFRYEKYNNFGEPMYNIALQAITNIDKIEPSNQTIT
jgi:hypothetical protein